VTGDFACDSNTLVIYCAVHQVKAADGVISKIFEHVVMQPVAVVRISSSEAMIRAAHRAHMRCERNPVSLISVTGRP
jgi:hypothetical protein